MKRPRLKSDWEGRYVRLIKKIENGSGTIFEAREIMKVYRNYGGLTLHAIKRCEHCNRRTRLSVSKVSELVVELLPEDWKPTDTGL